MGSRKAYNNRREVDHGEKVLEIAKELQASRKTFYSAIKSCVENSDVLIKDKSRKPRPRKTNLRTDTAMVRMAKIDSFKSSRQIFGFGF